MARLYMTCPARSARVACVDDCTQCPNLSSCAACAAATGAWAVRCEGGENETVERGARKGLSQGSW